jgi:hypothetical protein
MAGVSADISVVITGTADPASAQAAATSGKKQRIRAKAGKQRITESDDSKKRGSTPTKWACLRGIAEN